MTELFAEIALRSAPLKTLEGTLFGLLAQRPANGGNGNGNTGLLSAPQLADLWNIPETWVERTGSPREPTLDQTGPLCPLPRRGSRALCR